MKTTNDDINTLLGLEDDAHILVATDEQMTALGSWLAHGYRNGPSPDAADWDDLPEGLPEIPACLHHEGSYDFYMGYDFDDVVLAQAPAEDHLPDDPDDKDYAAWHKLLGECAIFSINLDLRGRLDALTDEDEG